MNDWEASLRMAGWTQAGPNVWNPPKAKSFGPAGALDSMTTASRVKHAPDEVEREADLREDIRAYCKSKGWLHLRGNTSQATGRTLGEPDDIIFADQGRTFIIECKSATGKLRPEQLGMKLLLETLGHGSRYLICRSFTEFLTFVK